MRVVHFSYAQSARPSKPEAWLHEIGFAVGVLESMSAYADVVSIYHIQCEASFEKNKIQYYFTNFNKWQLFFPIKFNSFIIELNPDVIILHGMVFPLQALMLNFQLKRKIKIIAQHHAEKPFRDFRKYFQRWVDRYISAYLFSAFELGMLWIKERQISHPSKIKIVMEASSPFYPIPKDQARERVPVYGNLNFLWIGNLTKNKDPFCVVTGFGNFLKHYPAANLWMIYKDNGLEADVKRLIKEKGAESSIHMIGKVEHKDLLFWYNSLDYIISTSHYEGSGIAVCEALSCGCIPIVTDIPSFNMMTDNGKIGLLFKPGDSVALSNCLLKIVTLDISQEKSKSRERFNSELSFNAIGKKIMEVINQIKGK